jgi:hypothetical protein
MVCILPNTTIFIDSWVEQIDTIVFDIHPMADYNLVHIPEGYIYIKNLSVSSEP